MIQRLYIKDFAIIDELSFPLKPGLTVITGETGSGKSILIEALSVSLGGKADKIMVKSGSERAVIETEFKDGTFRRLISQKGRTKAYRNEEPIALNDLISVNETRVDFHGQHDQQLILKSNRHIEYLDRFCNHAEMVYKVNDLYQELGFLRLKLDTLRKSAEESSNRLDLIKFQANEIDSVNPKLNEDIELDREFKKLSHLETILSTLATLQDQLMNGERSVTDILNRNLRSLEPLVQYDESLKRIMDLLNTSIIQLQEAGSESSLQLSNANFDPDELAQVEERLQALETLKRKYGGSIESVMEKWDRIEFELKEMTSPEQSETELDHKIKKLEIEFSSLSLKLHQTRKIKSKLLSKNIEQAMSDLNMDGARFEIQIQQQTSDNAFVSLNGEMVEENQNGIDIVEFFLSANPGEAVKPLASIASGGEISRIMLAIKTVFQEMDPVGTLVFDEIDSGISGLAAEKVAEQLVNLSKSKQVFCITHLSQIANKADHHLHVEKSVQNGKTSVSAYFLKENERTRVYNDLFFGSAMTSA